jgi:hypothetical protein
MTSMLLLQVVLASLADNSQQQTQSTQAFLESSQVDISRTLDSISARTNAKLEKIREQFGFGEDGSAYKLAPSSFLETDGPEDMSLEAVTKRLHALRDETTSSLVDVHQRLAALKQKFGPASSFLQTQAGDASGETDPDYDDLDKKLAEIHSKTDAKIKELLAQKGTLKDDDKDDEKADPSSFLETPKHNILHLPKFKEPKLPDDMTFGNAKYKGPSSEHLEAMLTKQDAVFAKSRAKLEAEYHRIMDPHPAPAKPSSFFQWTDDTDAVNTFTDKIASIAAKTEDQLKNINAQDSDYTTAMNERIDEGISLAALKDQAEEDAAKHRAADPSSFAQTSENPDDGFAKVEAKLKALQEKIKADTAKFEQEAKAAPSSFAQTSERLPGFAKLEQTVQAMEHKAKALFKPGSLLQEKEKVSAASEFAAGFQAVRDIAHEVQHNTEKSLEAMRAKTQGDGSSLLQTPSDDKIHSDFEKMKERFHKLEAKTTKQLAQLMHHRDRARNSLAKFEASSFLQESVVGAPVPPGDLENDFQGVFAQLHQIEAKAKKGLGSQPAEKHLRKTA